MDSVSVPLAPVLTDTVYDVNTGSGGYPFTPSLWHRDERDFHCTSLGLDSSTRNSSATRSENPGKSRDDGTENIRKTEWENSKGKEDGIEETPNGGDTGGQKQSQVACTLKWLTDNYERAEGVCLPRCVLYTHYLDFCKKMKYTPAGAATFGKIIRQKFPKLTTRRLGTRGQSKYHYYGIGIKETSIYYHSVYSGKGLTRFSGIKIKTEGSNRKYSLSAKTGTLLPEFPNASNLILPENIPREKMDTFIMMYRTHCQRILDTVISANFDEVQNFLLHFWQGMPEHLTELLKLDMISDVVALCDSILYKVLVDVLIPSTIQDLPESLGSEIKIFVKRLPYWLESSLDSISEEIRKKKIEVMKTFAHSVKRQLSFVHLAQTSRSVLLNHEILNQMIDDISGVDFSELMCQASYMTPSGLSTHKECIFDFIDEFQSLLKKQAPIEAYTEWLDNIIDRCVLQTTKEKSSFKERASCFLLQWETYCSLFMRDLTLQNATTFGSFHLLRMMCDEYIFLVLETQEEQNKEQNLQKNVQKYMKNAEEIKMHAKIRTLSSKHQISPKGKKRKHTDESYDSNDDPDTARGDENRPSVTETYSSLNGTAFSRPQPSYRDHCLADETCRPNFNHAPIPLSPLKHYPSLNGSSFERPTYLQYGLNTYSDFMSTSNSLTGPRSVQNYGDAHVQSFQSVPFSSSVAQTAGSYWTESRAPHSLHDPYTAYSYNKFHPTYDSYNKSSLLRAGSYQDAINRSAFDTSRPYYRSHDNFQVSNHLSMGGFTSNFMDIAQQPSQYPRQDSMFYQDDLYPGNMPSSFSTFGKTYPFSTPFR